MSSIFYFNDGAEKRTIKIIQDGENFFAKVDDKDEIQIQAKILGPDQFQFVIGNITYKCSIVKKNNQRFIHLDGQEYILDIIKEEDEDILQPSEEQGDLTSPMPGQIVKILTKEGEHVKKGQDLLIVEAMKMETRISSPIDGTVTKILYKEGDQIEAQVPLIEINPDEQPKDE